MLGVWSDGVFFPFDDAPEARRDPLMQTDILGGRGAAVRRVRTGPAVGGRHRGGGAGARRPRAGLASSQRRVLGPPAALGADHARRRARRRHRACGRILGAADPAGRAARTSRGPDQLPRRPCRSRRRDSAENGAARSRGGDRAARIASVEIVGRLDDYLVGTGYRITPVVGFVAAPPEFEADTRKRSRRSSRCRCPSSLNPPTTAATR